MPLRPGRKSAAQTPAPKSDKIYGSKVNKRKSADSEKSAKSISFSEQLTKTLKEKADKYNEDHSGKVSLSTLKAVFRRGAGAYSKSHRPTITGGVPNSRNAWAFARVNKFLEKKAGKPVKKAYVQDDDLMEKGGLIAPNGNKSNLTEEQYQLVRTPEFKAWFGDWEYLANLDSRYLEISDTKDYVNGILKDDNFPKKIKPNSILHYKKGFDYILSSDENGKIIGALTIYPNGKIDQLAISEKMRGMGIGKK